MRDGSRIGGGPAVRATARRAIFIALLAGCGGFQATAWAQDINSAAFDELRRTVELQQQQIRQLQAQAGANQQPPVAPDVAGRIPAASVGYEAAGSAPVVAGPPGSALPPGATVVSNEKTPLSLYWNNGLQAESANKEFTLHISGFMEWDAGTYAAPAATVAELRAINTNGFQDFQDNIDFRRARLRVDGTIYENIDYVAEYELADAFSVVRPKNPLPTTGINNSTTNNRNNTIEAASPANVYCTVKDIPWLGNVRTGQFLYKFSFDLATSDRWSDFIERSAAFDAFVPSSNTGNFMQGIMFFDTNEDRTMTWWNSLGINNDNDFLSGIALANDAFCWTGRVTWLPYYDEASGGRYLVHLGLDGQVQGLEGDVINYHDRGDVHEPYPITPSYVNQNVVGTYSELLGTEFVSVMGPWTIQQEFYASEVNGSNATGTAKGATNLFFEGGYVQVLYFLTGENRAYNRTQAAFDRVTPYENFFNVPGERTHCGYGAWQIGGRYSWVDLNDQGVHGGIVNEYTLGLNWFLNPNLRYSFNYCYTHVDDLGTAAATESINGFGVRMTMDF